MALVATYGGQAFKGGTGAQSQSISIGSPNTDRLLLVIIGQDAPDPTGLPTGVTFDGITGNLVNSRLLTNGATSRGSRGSVYVWKENELPAAGTYTLSFTNPATTYNSGLRWWTFTGAQQTMPRFAVTSKSGNPCAAPDISEVSFGVQGELYLLDWLWTLFGDQASKTVNPARTIISQASVSGALDDSASYLSIPTINSIANWEWDMNVVSIPMQNCIHYLIGIGASEENGQAIPASSP